MRTYESIGVSIPKILLPADGINLTKWSVVACDQYTSEPEYWDRVGELVGDSPSTLNLVLPEIYLGAADEDQRIHAINRSMREYLDGGLLVPYEGIFYIERHFGPKCRRGIMLCLDLEQYDFQRGSQSLIRATEGTIIERLPPRIKIREHAPLEVPHILVLIDDPHQTVIEPLGTLATYHPDKLVERYDFDLMFDSGHLTGFQIVDAAIERQVILALEALVDPEHYEQKYDTGLDECRFLFAMGDGNHSLATAKSIWERIKPSVGLDHPARYALVEVENIHDEGLEFAPIHRVLFGLRGDFLSALRQHFGSNYQFTPTADLQEMMQTIEQWCGSRQVFGVITANEVGVVEIDNPTSNLAVGTVQSFLDRLIGDGGAQKIDYVHGFDTVSRLGRRPGNVGLYLPCMDKNDLFKTVILDGALPRKTFSMGEAFEKRFYMESRKIVLE